MKIKAMKIKPTKSFGHLVISINIIISSLLVRKFVNMNIYLMNFLNSKISPITVIYALHMCLKYLQFAE